MSGRPTPEQLAEFNCAGFLVIRGFFEAAECTDLRRWTEELTVAPELPGRHLVYYEDSLTEPGRRIVQRIENMCPFYPGFDTLLRHGRLIAWAGALLGDEAVLFKDKINFKLPGGDGFKPHQDQQAGWSTYTDLFVTAMVSIDSTTAQNGCLELCAGQHTRGLIGEEWKPLTDDDMRRLGSRAVPTQPGDAVFFDSYTPHASAPNLTAERRRVLYITYNRLSAGDHRVQYYADKRKSFPPDIERDPNRTYTFRV